MKLIIGFTILFLIGVKLNRWINGSLVRLLSTG